MLDPKKYNEAKALFFRALSLPPGEGVHLFRSRYSSSELDSSPELTQLLRALEPSHRQESSLPELGNTIGSYRVERTLGIGGMGQVYLATSPDGTHVAIKKLHPHLGSEEVAGRFAREAKILAHLDHPGIVRFIELLSPKTAGDGTALVMEYVSGPTLSQFLEESAPDRTTMLHLIAELANAVGFAHEQGIVHRDLKPGNVLVERDGVPRVLDFGVARILDPRQLTLSRMTHTAQLMGTLQYMSPEQARLDSDVGPPSDVYSLGVVLYEALSGSLPYAELRTDSLPRMILAITNEEPRPLHKSDMTADPTLVAIVSRCLRKEPKERYATARHLGEDLERYLAGLPTIARPANSVERVTRVLRRRRRFAWTGIALLIALVLGAASSRFWQDPERKLREAYANIDQANTLIHFSARTEGDLEKASDLLDESGDVLITLDQELFVGHLRRFAAWRNGEARYLLGRIRDDINELDAAVDHWFLAHRLPFDPEIGARIPNDLGFYPMIVEDGRHIPLTGVGMVFSALARREHPLQHTKHAIESYESARAVLQDTTLTNYAVGHPEARFSSDLTKLSHGLGQCYLLYAGLVDSVEYAKRALEVLEVPDDALVLNRDPSFWGIYHDTYGHAFLTAAKLGEHEFAPARLDSSEARFIRALQFRTPDRFPIGHLSSQLGRVAVRREAGRYVEALSLLARSVDRAGLESPLDVTFKAALMEAEIRLDLLQEDPRDHEALDRVELALTNARVYAPPPVSSVIESNLLLVEGRFHRVRGQLLGSSEDLAIARERLHRGRSIMSESDDPSRHDRYLTEIVALTGMP